MLTELPAQLLGWSILFTTSTWSAQALARDQACFSQTKGAEKGDVEEKSSIILTGMIEDVFCGAANFYGGGSNYMKFGEQNVHNFDPGVVGMNKMINPNVLQTYLKK